MKVSKNYLFIYCSIAYSLNYYYFHLVYRQRSEWIKNENGLNTKKEKKKKPKVSISNILVSNYEFLEYTMYSLQCPMCNTGIATISLQLHCFYPRNPIKYQQKNLDERLL